MFIALTLARARAHAHAHIRVLAPLTLSYCCSRSRCARVHALVRTLAHALARALARPCLARWKTQAAEVKETNPSALPLMVIVFRDGTLVATSGARTVAPTDSSRYRCVVRWR
jgi:hypothetical protein